MELRFARALQRSARSRTLTSEPERLSGAMRRVMENNLEQLQLLERQLGELDP